MFMIYPALIVELVQTYQKSACVHRDTKHLGSLESTQEARVGLQTSRVLRISMNTRWLKNQLLIFTYVQVCHFSTAMRQKG